MRGHRVAKGYCGVCGDPGYICAECEGCGECCWCDDDALFDADELGLDPEDDDAQPR